MARDKFTLETGLKLNDIPQLECELREPTAGDVIEASEDSEKPAMIPNEKGVLEPFLITSPTLVGVHTLRRQIVRIGDIPGPLELHDLKRLTPADLNLIQEKAEQLEIASRAVTQQGRGDSAGAGDATSG